MCTTFYIYYYYYYNVIVGPVKRIVVRCCGIPRGYVSPTYVMSTTTHRKNPRDNNYYYYRYCGRESGKRDRTVIDAKVLPKGIFPPGRVIKKKKKFCINDR